MRLHVYYRMLSISSRALADIASSDMVWSRRSLKNASAMTLEMILQARRMLDEITCTTAVCK